MSASQLARGLATQWSRDHFGAPTTLRIRPYTFGAGAVLVQILPNDPDRIGWTIQNRSEYLIGLGFSGAVNTTTNLVIDSQGGSISMSLVEDGEAVTYGVWVISPQANQNICIVEETAR